MNTNLVREITARQIKKDVPAFKSGDTVSVSVRYADHGIKDVIEIYIKPPRLVGE